MTDPLADPRARELLATDPDEAGRLAGVFRTAAGESQRTGTGLSAAQHDTVWTGRAADAFHRAIGRLPARLDGVRAGFEAVAAALLAYETELASIKPAFALVAIDLRAMAGGAGGGGAPLADTEFERLSRRAFSLLEEFSNARAACQAAIQVARLGAPSLPAPAQAVVGTAAPAPAQAGVGAPSAATVVPSAAPVPGLPPGLVAERVAAMTARANTLLGTPYVWGGGHAGWGPGGGLDCSGFVSHVLHAGGYLNAPQTTEGLPGQPGLAAGPGRWVTVYDRTNVGANEHVIIDLNGRFYESGGGASGGGAAFVHQFAPSVAYLASFNSVLHPVGL
jgi:cell wall-associated NlpC family hydrolase